MFVIVRVVILNKNTVSVLVDEAMEMITFSEFVIMKMRINEPRGVEIGELEGEGGEAVGGKLGLCRCTS